MSNRTEEIILEATEKGGNDSIYAQGMAIHKTRNSLAEEARLLSGRAREVLQITTEMGCLTQRAVMVAVDCRPLATSRAVKSLWYAGMVNVVNIVTSSSLFKLWVAGREWMPANPQDACRLAILSLFYALARREVPEFSWRIVRSSHHPPMAEMTFKGKTGFGKWLIDAPRRGEMPSPKADLYIFPTVDEAIAVTPKGKLHTSDLKLLACQPGELRWSYKKKS